MNSTFSLSQQWSACNLTDNWWERKGHGGWGAE